MDEDANHNVNKVHKEGTLVGSLEQSVDSEAYLRVPSLVAFRDHLKLEVMLEIQVMGELSVQLTLEPANCLFQQLC